jgi:antitoxin component YwqK of YwqJK toxin-antitoxin module
MKIADQDHVQLHKDGSLWAKGKTRSGKPTGYWEWFRKDGTKLRSGHFERGEQVGDWTTYDKNGAVYKVTAMKSKRARVGPGITPRRTPHGK